MTRSFEQLQHLETFEERFRYLSLSGRVGDATFGFDRWINQLFYRSTQWRRVRSQVIARDYGCDLGVPGFEIHHNVVVHHMNPMTSGDITNDEEFILDPNFLITTSHETHNAIHYGDERKLLPSRTVRSPGDTKLW